MVIKLYSGSEYDLDVSVVVSEDNLINGYIPKENDLITGAIWLCGMITTGSE
jgi:hypothetical protein